MVALLDAIGVQLNVAPIDGAKADLAAARNGLNAANAGGVNAALVTVGNAICALDALLDQFPNGTFEVLASPNSQVTTAGTASTFTIYVQNKSARPRTFRLSMGTLPAGDGYVHHF